MLVAKLFRLLLCLMILVILSCDIYMDQARESTVDIVEMPSGLVPIAQIMLVVDAGSADDPPGQYGLARFTAGMIMNQRAAPDGMTYREILGSSGSSFSVEVNKTSTTYRFESLTDHLDSTYGLIARAFLKPMFSSNIAEESRTLQVDSLNEIIRNAEALAAGVVYGELYSGTAYAHPAIGMTDDIRSLTVEAADSFYTSCYTLDNISIRIGGKYPPELVERIRSDFGELPLSPPKKTSLDVLTKQPENRVVLTESRFADSIVVAFASLPMYSQSDIYTLLLVDSYLRLKLREFNGCRLLPLPIDQFDTRTPIHMSISAKCASSIDAIYCMKSVVYELTRLADGYAEPEFLASARDDLINSYLFTHETIFERLRSGHRPINPNDSTTMLAFEDRVSAIAMEDMCDVALIHWPHDSALIVVVTGDAHEFREKLIQFSAPTGIPENEIADPAVEFEHVVMQHDLGIGSGDIAIRDVPEDF